MAELKNKVKTVDEILDLIKDGDVVMVGGFLNLGGPNKLITELMKKKELKNLTLIANDTGIDSLPGISQLVIQKTCKKIIASHVGTNKETGNQMASGETEVVLTPQGSLAEKIRAGGFGLGGILTPTGVGIPEIEEGKETVEVDGKKFLLEKPLKADVALLNAYKVDRYGNMEFRGSTRNFNELMAFAADTVIVEADHVVEVGEIDPNYVGVPGILVDVIVDGKALD